MANVEVTTSTRPDDIEASISILGTKGFAQIGGLAANELQIFTPDQKKCKIYSENIPDAYVSVIMIFIMIYISLLF